MGSVDVSEAERGGWFLCFIMIWGSVSFKCFQNLTAHLCVFIICECFPDSPMHALFVDIELAFNLSDTSGCRSFQSKRRFIDEH